MRKLKILIVAHNLISNTAGAGKVHFELQQEYIRLGYSVDKVDVKDLFPKGQNSFQRIFAQSFTLRIFEYLKNNAYKYDIIDANLTNVVYSKSSFNFKGLLFARSQGIMPLYDRSYQIDRFSKVSASIRKNRTIKSRIGDFIRTLQKDFTMDDFNASVKFADIVHCLNQSEYDYHLSTGVKKEKLVLLPNGLAKEYLNEFEVANQGRENNKKIVSFIGAWHIVKGSKDWREIAELLLEINDFKQIKILGSVMTEEYVKQDFNQNTFPFLRIVPRYKPNELPLLLKNVKVGIFSSYMEGLPYAILEQLACGIPVVGYRVPGVIDFLSQVDTNLLLEPGDFEGLVEKAKQILEIDKEAYEILSKKCIEVSKQYCLEDIAPLFLEAYQKGLNKIDYQTI